MNRRAEANFAGQSPASNLVVIAPARPPSLQAVFLKRFARLLWGPIEVKDFVVGGGPDPNSSRGVAVPADSAFAWDKTENHHAQS
jgi:hypothetical protein